MAPVHRAEPTKTYEQLLHETVAEYYADPLGFTYAMYPWGEPGWLQAHDGPDVWQVGFLKELGQEVRKRGFDGLNSVPAVRMATSSGHGVGKTVGAAFVVDWLMSTRPHCKGVVTANTGDQLRDKTWATIRRWTKACRTGHWFEINTERMYHKAHPESWFCTAQTCREENSEAFAGQHAADSSSFYINDEDSNVPDAIHKVQWGGLTDGEPFQFLFGNATRRTGAFYDACFGSQRHRFISRRVDARESRYTNKEHLESLIEDEGIDSDEVRVRILGLPPNSDSLQFIDSERVWQAMRNVVSVMPSDPLIAGVDVSGGGKARTVCRFRRGMDARTIPPISFTGTQTNADDRQMVVSRLAEVLSRRGKERVDAMFVDSAFGSPIVVHLRNRGFLNVFEVNFGGPSPNERQLNQRAYQWNAMKEWLRTGAIPEKDDRLEADLCGPGFKLNNKNQLVLESKEAMASRNVASPDDGDALSLTFAQPVQVADDGPDEQWRPSTMYG